MHVSNGLQTQLKLCPKGEKFKLGPSWACVILELLFYITHHRGLYPFIFMPQTVCKRVADLFFFSFQVPNEVLPEVQPELP